MNIFAFLIITISLASAVCGRDRRCEMEPWPEIVPKGAFGSREYFTFVSGQCEPYIAAEWVDGNQFSSRDECNDLCKPRDINKKEPNPERVKHGKKYYNADESVSGGPKKSNNFRDIYKKEPNPKRVKDDTTGSKKYHNAAESVSGGNQFKSLKKSNNFRDPRCEMSTYPGNIKHQYRGTHTYYTFDSGSCKSYNGAGFVEGINMFWTYSDCVKTCIRKK